MTYQDILRTIPPNVARVKAGEDISDSWEPERARRWLAILCERHPDLAKLREAASAIEYNPDDPYGELMDLRKRLNDEAASL